MTAAMRSPTVRRTVIAALLVIAAGAAVLASRLDSGSEQPLPEIVRSISPADGDTIPQQGQIEVELMAGWAGRLTVDQRPIPEDQVNRAGDPTIATHLQLIFQPGPGKAFESF